MSKMQKIVVLVVKISLVHLLTACQQPNFNDPKHNYENQIDLCLVPTQEQSITEVSLFVSQVHLYTRQESVFQNILSCIMD